MPVKIRFQPGLKPIIQKHQSGNHDQESHGNWAGYPGELSDKIFEEWVEESRNLKKKKLKMGVPDYVTNAYIDSELFQSMIKTGDIKLTKKQIDELRIEEKRVEEIRNKQNKITEEWYNDHFINKNKNPNSFSGMSDEIQKIRDEYVAKQIKGEDVVLSTNRALRNGRFSSRAERFDKLVETSVVKEPVILWRGAILPQNLVDSLQKGTSFVDKGFQSTGVRRREGIFYAEQRFSDQKFKGIPVLFKMKVNKGVNAVDVGYGETVVQRNTKMRITGVKSGPKIKTGYDEIQRSSTYGPNFVVVDVEVDKAS